MPTAIKRPARVKPTLHRLHAELARLRRRVDDLEDLRDLNAAISRNAGEQRTDWARAKKELGLA